MKKIYFIISAIIVLLTTSCNNTGNSVTTADSLKIARTIAEKYPDSIQLKKRVIVFGNSPIYNKSMPIDDQLARKEHISYLKNGTLRDSKGQVIYSLFLDKKELSYLDTVAETGVRLAFCEDTYNDTTYTGIILVPLNESYHNILSYNGKTAIINRLEPCPNKCPERNPAGIYHDSTDLNHDYYGDFGNKGLWFNAQTQQWVDIKTEKK
jgi:hypothetical protein